VALAEAAVYLQGDVMVGCGLGVVAGQLLYVAEGCQGAGLAGGSPMARNCSSACWLLVIAAG
jgi:hypothetical protein